MAIVDCLIFFEIAQIGEEVRRKLIMLLAIQELATW